MNRVIRAIPRFSRYSVSKSWQVNRFFSTKFGYECNTLSNLDYDVTFLEKSLRAGSRVVMTKSGHCDAAVDLMLDLAEFDGIEFKDLTLSHVCKLPKVTMRNEKISTSGDHWKHWTDELTRMNKVLHKRNKTVDVVLAQVPQLEHLTTADLTSLLNSFQTYFKASGDVIITPPRLGLDLDSAFLYGLSDTQVDRLIRLLDPLTTAAAPLGALSLSSSPLTVLPAHRLVQWARGKGLLTLSSEVLRCHPRRPSQVATNFSHANDHVPIGEDKIFKKPQLTPEVEQSQSISGAEKQRMLAIMDAANDLTMSLDRCLKVEKRLLDELYPEFKPPAVNPSSICLAHILSSNINQFIFPEEFNHIASSQIEPLMKDACQALSMHNSKLADWVSLYKSMNKYLISSYRNLLQYKALRLSQSIQDQLMVALPELEKYSIESSNKKLSTTSLDDMAMIISVLSALTVGADHTLVTYTKVESTKWSVALEELSSIDRSRLVKVMNQIADTLRQEWVAAEPTAANKQLK